MEPPVTSEITVAYPDVADRHLRISVGACRLSVVPGEADAWVTGSYDDPSGALPCEHVRTTTGLSSVELRIPAATAAKIFCESLLGGLNASSGFKRQGGAFWTETALADGSPLLTIHTNVALGALRLVAT
jgi:hypothetical protein